MRHLLFLLLILLLVSCASTGERTTVVRVGYFPNITHSQALIGMAPSSGAFQKAFGDKVRVEGKVFNAGPSAIEALFAGEIDLTYIGPNPAINGYARSKGEALRIIAGATSAGAVLVVRQDAGISSAADLAGKRIATPELGNTQDVAARHYLLSNDLRLQEKGGTVSILPVSNPDILTLFIKQEIDAAWVPEPWGARLVHDGGGKIMLDERSLWPDGRFVTTHLIARTKFLKQYPDLVKTWLGAHIDLTRWIQEHPDDAKKQANAEITRLTGKGLDSSVLDEAWQRMEVTYDPISPSLFQSADRAFKLGLLGRNMPDLSGIYDLNLLNEVLTARELSAVQ